MITPNLTSLFKLHAELLLKVNELIDYVNELLNEFEPLKGYESLYKINRLGHIYSCKQNKILKNQTNTNEYQYINLTLNGNVKKNYIHRLLGIQYIRCPSCHVVHDALEKRLEIDHIDRNRTNNSLANLRWVTHQENLNNKSNNIKNLSKEALRKRAFKLQVAKKRYANILRHRNKRYK